MHKDGCDRPDSPNGGEIRGMVVANTVLEQHPVGPIDRCQFYGLLSY
jgi:hypothetical protein